MENKEAPTPFLSKEKFEQQCSITIKQNILQYNLNFGTYGESIYFELYDFQKENYKYIGIFNLSKLKEINDWFKQFSSLEKIIKAIKKKMNSNEFKIKEEQGEAKTIYFKNPEDEEDIICIELNKQEKTKKEIIKELLSTANEKKKKNILLENKVNTLNTLINNMEKKYDEKIKILEEKMNNMSKIIEKQNKIGEVIEEISMESLIVSKKEDINLLKEWISPYKNILFKLIYRATRDGDTYQDFHRMCDNKSPTICIMKTPKGYIFGGYTTVLFNNPENKDLYLKDKNAFVFSLNKREKFNTKDKNKSIGIDRRYLIIFGNGKNSIQIKDNALNSNEHWSNPNGSYGANLNLTENKNFSIVEMEVFKVEFI